MAGTWCVAVLIPACWAADREIPNALTAEEKAGLAIGLDELDAGHEIEIDAALRVILGAPAAR